LLENLVCLRKRLRIPLVFEFDDHFLDVPRYNEAGRYFHRYSTLSGISKVQLLVSDAATTTTDHMAGIYREHQRNIVVLPNCIDPEDIGPFPVDPARANDKSVRIVFAGGSGHYGDLATIRTPLERILEEFPQTRMFFMGCLPDWATKYMANSLDPSRNRVFTTLWVSYQHFPRILQWGGFDIALAPLVTNEFNFCKSNLKWLDYSVAGIAGVYSDLKTYSNVTPRETGMVASGDKEWYHALRELIVFPDFRRHMAEKARATVLRDYSVDQRIHLWQSAYERFAALEPNVECLPSALPQVVAASNPSATALNS
jgi:glycosyltransferase involved in cell wall biosynthesis